MKQGEEAVGVLLDTLNELRLDYMVVGSFSSNRYGVITMVRRSRDPESAGRGQGRGGVGMGE